MKKRLRDQGGEIERVVVERDLRREYQEFLQEHNPDRPDSNGRPERGRREIQQWAHAHEVPFVDAARTFRTSGSSIGRRARPSRGRRGLDGARPRRPRGLTLGALSRASEAAGRTEAGLRSALMTGGTGHERLPHQRHRAACQGHRPRGDIKTTQRYLNISDEELRKALTGVWDVGGS